jgi:glycosyltransferase involved in cell wall biosynthesis
MPHISVVIPAYNAQRTLQETVCSVQDQTFLDIEIIIINDGSTDKTWSLIQSLTDPRIKAFSYENGGVSVARNRGIDHATGEFIAFLDADDLWTSNKLESQIEAINVNPETDVAYSWTSYFHESKEKSYPGNPMYFQGDVYAELLKWNFLASGSNPLIRRRAIEDIGGFDPTLPPCEDWDFYLRLAAKYKFVVVLEHQVVYRQSSTSATASKFDFIEKQCLEVLEKNYQRAPEKYQYLKCQSLAWIYQYCTQLHLQNATSMGSMKMATQKLWKAVRLNPKILSEGYGQSLLRWLIKRWLLVLMPSTLLLP